jgi:hypothetical protein
MSARLCSAHAKGTVAVLLPTYRFLSPAIGLALLHQDAPIAKLLSAPLRRPSALHSDPFDTACALSRELFYVAGSRVRPSTNMSSPAAQLGLRQLGTLVGLALQGCGDAELEAGLRGGGISTNRVDGRWTGVSMARHMRLARSVRAACHDQGGKVLALPLLLRYVWERAESKRCLLDFLDAVHHNVPILSPVLSRTAELGCEATRSAFIASAFTSADLTAPALKAAAWAVVDPPPEAANAAPEPLELLAAALSQALTFKPPIRLRRHAYVSGAPREVPDCVEVVLREVFDLLLFDPETSRMDVQRLPVGCAPGLFEFYAARADRAVETSGAEDSAAWFAVCQGLDGCEYLSLAPGERPYELKPSLSNVACAAGRLLQPRGQAWQRMTDLAEFWNGSSVQRGRIRGQKLEISERADISRGIAAEESLRRERAQITLHPGSRHSLDVLLDPAHNTATAAHRSIGSDWVDAELLEAQAQAWARAPPASCDPVLSSALWPALLGDAMLLKLGSAKPFGADTTWSCNAVTRRWQAVLWSRWADEDAFLCAPLHGENAAANLTAAEERRGLVRQGELLVRALSMCAQISDAEIAEWLIKAGRSARASPADLASALFQYRGVVQQPAYRAGGLAGSEKDGDPVPARDCAMALVKRALVQRADGGLVVAMLQLLRAVYSGDPAAQGRLGRALRLLDAIPGALFDALAGFAARPADAGRLLLFASKTLYTIYGRSSQ